MTQEVWAEIQGFPNYVVSNYGYVMSLNTNKLMKTRSNGYGYLRVMLCHEGVTRDFYIHQLVAMAFFGDFTPGTHVQHVNGNLEDNATWNLRLKRGRETHFSDYRPPRKRQVGRRVQIVETGEVFRTVRDCADHIGGDYASIYACLRGERKTHLGYTFEYDGDYIG